MRGHRKPRRPLFKDELVPFSLGRVESWEECVARQARRELREFLAIVRESEKAAPPRRRKGGAQ